MICEYVVSAHEARLVRRKAVRLWLVPGYLARVEHSPWISCVTFAAHGYTSFRSTESRVGNDVCAVLRWLFCGAYNDFAVDLLQNRRACSLALGR